MSEVKAWTFTTPGYPQTLQQRSVPAPSKPSNPTSLLIRLHAAAVNPVDIQLMNFPVWRLPFLSYPKRIGGDFAGTVLAAGDKARDSYKQGDEVFGFLPNPLGSGALAEVLEVDTAKACLLKKPKRWSWVQAAALPLVWLTSRTCVQLVEPYLGAEKRVAVLGGSSATGMYVVYLAKQRGWTVLASCSGRNAEFVKGMGASEVVDYTQESVAERVKAFRPDAIVDCVGGTEMLGIARRYVTIVGDKTGRSSMGGSATYLWNPQMVLRWLWGWLGVGAKYDCVLLDPKKEYLAEALDLPQDKIIIDSTFPFDQADKAYERLHTARARGKVVVEVKE